MPVTTCSDEQGEAGAAEYVEPARAAARHPVSRGFPHGLAKLQARVKPCANLFEPFNQAHVPPLVFPTVATLGISERVGI